MFQVKCKSSINTMKKNADSEQSLPETENEVNTDDFIVNNIGLSAVTSGRVVDGDIKQFRKNEISTPINVYKHNDGCSPESIARLWLEITRKKRADNSFLRMQGKGSLLRDGFLSDVVSMPGLTGGGVILHQICCLIFRMLLVRSEILRDKH